MGRELCVQVMPPPEKPEEAKPDPFTDEAPVQSIDVVILFMTLPLSDAGILALELASEDCITGKHNTFSEEEAAAPLTPFLSDPEVLEGAPLLISLEPGALGVIPEALASASEAPAMIPARRAPGAPPEVYQLHIAAGLDPSGIVGAGVGASPVALRRAESRMPSGRVTSDAGTLRPPGIRTKPSG